VFIGTSDPDPHVPVQRVLDSVKILKNMNAQVTDKIYKNMGHTINEDEIETVNNLIFNF
jgi:phospholipase/carboxylesterase